MTEEPYRWLEAIANRREYIRDQLKGGTPVFAISRPEGIFLMGVGQGQSKVFEIYDRHAFAGLGHPVDIEKLRQSAIEAAHVEGFNRSSQDVTLRRLIAFALCPMLKNSFEQIFSPPVLVESIFAEVGESPERDTLVRVHYDGNHHFQLGGVAVASTDSQREKEAHDWIEKHIKAKDPIKRVAEICLDAWKILAENKPFNGPAEKTDLAVEGRVLEVALLDRKAPGHVHYRPLELSAN
jgi:proteasome alpha subunit